MNDQPQQAPSEEEMAAFVHQSMINEIVHALGVYTNATEEVRKAHAVAILQEQEKIGGEVIPTLIDPKLVQAFPTMLINVTGPTGTYGSLSAPKRIEGYTDPGLALYNAFMMALLTSPIARAVLRIHGFNYTFAQSKAVLAEKGKIIV